MIVTPTLAGKAPREVDRSVTLLRNECNRLQAQVTALQTQVASLPAPLTVQQVQAGLSASGAAPLNLTGLVGAPATSSLPSGTTVPAVGGGSAVASTGVLAARVTMKIP